jgi:hypothetical protein
MKLTTEKFKIPKKAHTNKAHTNVPNSKKRDLQMFS